MKRILLLGATFSTGNMGVGALASGALAVIRKRYPEASVSLLDYGREAIVFSVRIDGRLMSVPLLNLRFSWKVFLSNNIATLLVMALFARCLGSGARRKLIARNRWLKAIAEADAALAVSGGDSFSDIYGLGRFFYVALPQLLAVILGVKLVLLPQTIGPFRGAFPRGMASYLLRRASMVYSRDRKGLAEAAKLIEAAETPKLRFCQDMGFVVEPHAPRHFNVPGFTPGSRACRPLVGLNVSGLLLMGGYTKSNMFELKLDYAELIDRIVTQLVEEKYVDVLLVPHVFGEHDESDTRAALSVRERLKGRHGRSLFCVDGCYDQNEIKYIIGLCDFFIGARMHACIAALSQGIPTVGIAYSDKFAGVFESVGTGSMVIDPRHAGEEESVRAILQAFDERHRARMQLKEAMPRIKEHVLELLDDIT